MYVIKKNWEYPRGPDGGPCSKSKRSVAYTVHTVSRASRKSPKLYIF